MFDDNFDGFSNFNNFGSVDYSYDSSPSYYEDDYYSTHAEVEPIEDFPVVLPIENQAITWDVSGPLSGQAFAAAAQIDAQAAFDRAMEVSTALCSSLNNYRGEQDATGWLHPTADEHGFGSMTGAEFYVYQKALAAFLASR